MIVRSCIHDLPGFRPQNRCRRSSKRRERERERIVVPSSLNWTNSIRARIFLERCTAGSPEREREKDRERTEEIEEEAENRSNLVERAITRMARQTSPRPLLGRVLFSLRQIERQREGEKSLWRSVNRAHGCYICCPFRVQTVRGNPRERGNVRRGHPRSRTFLRIPAILLSFYSLFRATEIQARRHLAPR